ncbi:MAG: GAF domain-containing protein [Planctomycetes bacterium]|nr:GAF domain-containing protein [Planctomycetota bacterium]
MLTAAGAQEPVPAEVLRRVLAGFDCVAGTLHRLDSRSGLLELVADHGLPAPVREKSLRIPIGKGMAGIAAQRLEPVQVCNLQTDSSGVARPGARETPVEGAIALPMIVGGELAGVLGVAKPHEYEFPPEEIDVLMQIAAAIGKRLVQPT